MKLQINLISLRGDSFADAGQVIVTFAQGIIEFAINENHRKTPE